MRKRNVHLTGNRQAQIDYIMRVARWLKDHTRYRMSRGLKRKLQRASDRDLYREYRYAEEFAKRHGLNMKTNPIGHRTAKKYLKKLLAHEKAGIKAKCNPRRKRRKSKRNPVGDELGPVRPWRKPDVKVGDDYAIWYGPQGPEGDVATEVDREADDLYTVSEYQDVTGLIDDPPDFVLKTSTQVYAQSLREAAAKGVEAMQRWGGEEEFVSQIPQPS